MAPEGDAFDLIAGRYSQRHAELRGSPAATPDDSALTGNGRRSLSAHLIFEAQTIAAVLKPSFGEGGGAVFNPLIYGNLLQQANQPLH